jgi:signal transduction histidine kinase
MSRMIQQILDLTRSRLAGGIEVSRKPMDLSQVLSSIDDELRTAYPRAAIDLRCRPIMGHGTETGSSRSSPT